MHNIKTILALDTSTAKKIILGLYSNNLSDCQDIATDHTESILIDSIDGFLKKNNISIKDIDLFIIGCGPGSFMGLRLGFSVLRTWAWLYQKPIITISSLKLFTLSFVQNDNESILIPCIDGKMKRVFTNISLNNKLLVDDCDIFPKDFAEKIQQLRVDYKEHTIKIFGSGTNLLEPFLNSLSDIEFYPDAVINHNCFMNLQQFIPNKINTEKLLDIAFPNYLRLSAAELALEESKKAQSND